MATKTVTIVGKGSSGKTRSIIELAKIMAQRGQEVTIIDLDPQRSVTFATFGDFKTIRSVSDVLLGKCNWAAARIKSNAGYYLLPGAPGLGEVFRTLDRLDTGFLALRAIVAKITGVVLIDPSAEVESFSFTSAITASDLVVSSCNPCVWACEVAKSVPASIIENTDVGMGITPKFAGHLITIFSGKIVGGVAQIPMQGIARDKRDALTAIRELPSIIGYIPARRGKDQRDLVAAYSGVADRLFGEVQA